MNAQISTMSVLHLLGIYFIHQHRFKEPESSVAALSMSE